MAQLTRQKKMRDIAKIRTPKINPRVYTVFIMFYTRLTGNSNNTSGQYFFKRVTTYRNAKKCTLKNGLFTDKSIPTSLYQNIQVMEFCFLRIFFLEKKISSCSLRVNAERNDRR